MRGGMGQSLDCDVAIVGGGVSGVSLALFLRQHGLRSVVLEKTDRLGGKTWTYDLEDSVSELGACYLAQDYGEVAALAEHYGLSILPLGSVEAEPGSLVGDFYKTSAFGRIAQAVGILATLARYAGRRRKALAAFAAGDPAACAALAAPTSEWLKQEGCEGLRELIILLVDRFGYGPMESIPALYTLRWVTPAVVMTAIRRDTRQLDLGFGELVRRMADGLDVRLSTPFTTAERNAAGGWTLATAGGPLTVRHLAIACSPTDPVLTAPFDAARREILEQDLASIPYACALVQVSGWFQGRQVTSMKAGDYRDQLLAARRDGTAPDGSGFYACYLYPSVDSEAHIEAVLRRDIAARGGRVDRFIAFNRASHFLPHVRTEAIRAGRYGALERGQGAENLWLCNAVLAHENWRDLIALSRTIAGRIAEAR